MATTDVLFFRARKEGKQFLFSAIQDGKVTHREDPDIQELVRKLKKLAEEEKVMLEFSDIELERIIRRYVDSEISE